MLNYLSELLIVERTGPVHTAVEVTAHFNQRVSKHRHVLWG